MTAKTVMARSGRAKNFAMPTSGREKGNAVSEMARKIAEAKPLSKSELIAAFAGVKRRSK